DLVRALTQRSDGDAPHPRSTSGLGRLVKALDSTFHHDTAPSTANPPPAQAETFSAADFRELHDAFLQSKTSRVSNDRRAAAEAHDRRVREMLHEHVPDGPWREKLAKAHEAATHGEKQSLLLRFPSDLCTDRGRKINVAEADWPSTLRGEPAELYLHWERELRPRGFGIAASVLDFPGGMPGDIGLFLTWGG
ncbi:MAG: histidine kinase, partial [Alphaproteobacteria bacterium]|nr:histidine kinase [Alphaproteobacteria bacterium]